MRRKNPVEQAEARDRDDTEVRNWMLPLTQQDFRVPDPSRIRLPEDAVEWSGRLFLLTRWFRRVTFWLTCLAVVIVLFNWTVWFVS